MINLVNYFGTKYRGRDISKVDMNSVDVISSPKLRLMGITLHGNFLILNIKYFYSFRLIPQNIGFLGPFMLVSSKKPINKDCLGNYFSQNHDNPYALQNVMNCIGRGISLDNLTQFPPLYLKKDIVKQRKGIEEIYAKAQLGDCIFTFDRNSGISRLIRKIDHGQFSHVGVVDKNKTIVEMAASGLTRSHFSSLYRTSLDVALYRPRNSKLTPCQQEKMQNSIEDSLKQHIGFGWHKLLFVFLHKKMHLPIKHPSTPAGLLYANTLELIAYV